MIVYFFNISYLDQAHKRIKYQLYILYSYTVWATCLPHCNIHSIQPRYIASYWLQVMKWKQQLKSLIQRINILKNKAMIVKKWLISTNICNHRIDIHHWDLSMHYRWQRWLWSKAWALIVVGSVSVDLSERGNCERIIIVLLFQRDRVKFIVPAWWFA